MHISIHKRKDVVMQSALAECLKSAKFATQEQIIGASDKITRVDDTISRAELRIKALFGFEANAKPVIQAHVGKLRKERERLQNLSKYGQFGCLDTSPLKWRDASGYPRLVVLSLDSPRFELSVVCKQGWRVDSRSGNDVKMTQRKSFVFPKLPKVIACCYRDVLERLVATAKESRKSQFLATEYNGVIPDQTREKIHEALKQFSGVFLIAEAKNWSLTEKKPKQMPRPNRGDPIVVGFDGSNLWVIDSFDLTPIERLVKSEFTIKAI